MSAGSSCASSAASTPTFSSAPLPADASSPIIKIPMAPVMTTASAPQPTWRIIELHSQDSDDFRPPGLMCYSTTPHKARRETEPAQSPQAFTTADPKFYEAMEATTAKTENKKVLSGFSGLGKASNATRKGSRRSKPYDTALPPLKDALYAASRAKLQHKPEGSQWENTFATGTPAPQSSIDHPGHSPVSPPVVDNLTLGIKVSGRIGDGKHDLVPINPAARPLPRASPPLSGPGIPLMSSAPLQILTGTASPAPGPVPDPPSVWTSLPASLPSRVPSQTDPLPFPESYPDLPQWQRLSLLRSDYASNAFSAKARALEVHARDYRAGILLLSLLDVLRDRQAYVTECLHDMQQMARNVTEMQQMGCSWREMGVAECHQAANEFFKGMWGCEFEDTGIIADGAAAAAPLKMCPRLKEDGTSGASLPVGNISGYPDGVHLPSLERLIGIPIKRSDEKMSELDVQKMGRAFAEDPFEVLKGLVRGLDGSKYAPLEV